MNLAAYFANNLEEFDAASAKPFRKALHPLVRYHKQSTSNDPNTATHIVLSDASLNNKITSMFRAQNWIGVLNGLQTLEANDDEVPKLGIYVHKSIAIVRILFVVQHVVNMYYSNLKGSLQRWIRDCDVVSRLDPEMVREVSLADGPADEYADAKAYADNMSVLLLSAVLRVMHAKQSRRLSSTGRGPPLRPPPGQVSVAGEAQRNSVRGAIVRHPAFSAPTRSSFPGGFTSATDTLCGEGEAGAGGAVTRVVSHVRGADRRPPCEQDLNIHMLSPNTIRFHATAPPPYARYDVPNVPGAFVMSGILSPDECRQVIRVAEGIGYSPDTVLGIDGIVLLADDSLMSPIYERVRPLLPQYFFAPKSDSTQSKFKLCGINCRWRLFRYFAGAVYRPHIDGAWPGSGMDASGQFSDDVFGDRHSRLTFLVYLNDDFEGGGTTFFQPRMSPPEEAQGEAPDSDGCKYRVLVDAWGVRPQQGSVLCFPHGDFVESLVHEGSAVTRGVKYVIRTDVLYSTSAEPVGSEKRDCSGNFE